ncbi:acyltransferase family protein [Paraburkholderia sp. RL17-347-BIC-D]|uniref:acyltransferase family protein n=1 Tax=Paraburkholderia sp. RL17-347-BIC-D TaxID=3031632 RepID=UPI0038BA22FD
MKIGNNYDFIRLIAASIVIVGHAYPINGLIAPEILGTPLHVYGVIIFFSISGYLIAQSWMNDPDPVRFFMKRGLRIFPALIVVVLLSAFVLGPLVSTLSVSNYFSNGSTYFYLRSMGLYIIYYLPGVFEHAPIANATNGSLWSLPAEFFMYIVTPTLMVLAGRGKSIAFALLTVVAACAAIYIQIGYTGPRLVVYATEVRAAVSMAAYFAMGAFLAVCKKVPLRTEYAVFAFLAYVLAIVLPTGVYRPYIAATVTSVTIPYIFITMGQHSTRLLKSAGRYGDFSYGLYLYAFPIQQVLTLKLPHMPLVTHIGLAFILTIPCAALSWHLIEKKALTFKPRESSRLSPASAIR